MTSEQIEIARKAFEEWCYEVGFDPKRGMQAYQEYADDDVEMRWDGWLARAEQRQWRPIADVLPHLYDDCEQRKPKE